MKYQLINETLQTEFDSLGGTLTSFKSDGMEYLWQGDECYWKGQSPVMFPICGSLRNEKAMIGREKHCELMRHGFARFEEFIVTEKTDGSISFTLQASSATLNKYPYPFVLTITYRLEERRLRTIYTVKTLGDEPMPFFVGGHPGFNCPLDPGDTFSDYVIEFDYQEEALCPLPAEDPLLLDVTNRREILHGEKLLRLNYDLFTDDALVFDALKSRKVRYYNPSGNQGLKVEFHDFPFLVLWTTKNRGPFIAIEPWLGISTCTDEDDIFEHKRNVQVAGPGETKRYEFSISVL